MNLVILHHFEEELFPTMQIIHHSKMLLQLQCICTLLHFSPFNIWNFVVILHYSEELFPTMQIIHAKMLLQLQHIALFSPFNIWNSC